MDDPLRAHLVELLTAEGSHLSLDTALDGLPEEMRDRRPEGLPRSPKEILGHIRIAHWDYLELARNPRHVRPTDPIGCGPFEDSWDEILKAFRQDLDAMIQLARDPGVDLHETIRDARPRTRLRMILLAADHIAYHTAELVAVRRLLGCWRQSS